MRLAAVYGYCTYVQHRYTMSGDAWFSLCALAQADTPGGTASQRQCCHLEGQHAAVSFG